jgi:hypothetical protein
MATTRSKRVTALDDFLIITEALAFAIEGMSRLPDQHRPAGDITEMKNLLSNCLPDDEVLAVFQYEAQRRVAMLSERNVNPLRK